MLHQVNIRLYCFLFVAFFLPALSFTQSSPCYFQNDFGTAENEISYSLIEFGDGTIYVAGKKANGPIGQTDAALLKYDSCGNLLWIKYYGDTLENTALSICKTYDGNIVIIGETENSSGFNDVALYKLDTSGSIIFQKIYNPTINQSAKYIEETSDHGFVFCGFMFDGNVSNDSYFVKTDSAGNVMWQQQIGGTGNEYADAVHETPEGNFIGTGDATSYGEGGYDIELIKFRADGSIIWDKTYGDEFNNGCQGVNILSDGNYISFGETETYSGSAFDFFLEITDTAGNSLGRHLFGGIKTDALFSLVELPGMNFLCTGYSRSYNNSQPYDIVLFKVDSSGTMKALKNISNPGIDIGYYLAKSSFGGFLITGLYDNVSSGTTNNNFFLMRSDTLWNTDVGYAEMNTMDEEYSFYPVPCDDQLTILTRSNAGATAELINVLGATVEQIQLNSVSNTLPTAFVPSGIYFVRVRNASGQVLSRKILVSH